MSFNFVSDCQNGDLGVKRGYDWKQSIIRPDDFNYTEFTDIIMKISKKLSEDPLITISLLTSGITLSGDDNESLDLELTNIQTNSVTKGRLVYELYFIESNGDITPFNDGIIQFYDSLNDT